MSSSSFIWNELGISPTSDEKAIKRAYAAQLKAIDVDRDAAGFQRLRRAYEMALAFVRRAHQASPPLPITPLPEPPLDPPPTLIVQSLLPDETRVEIADARREMNEALSRGAIGEAFAHYDRAAARGLFAIGSRDAALEKIMQAVVADTSILGAEYCAIMERAGWHKVPGRGEWRSKIRHAAEQKFAAEQWLQHLKKLAAEGPRISRSESGYTSRGPQVRRLLETEQHSAQAILGERRLLFLSRAVAQDLEKKLSQARHFQPWLGTRLEADDLSRIDRRLKWEEKWGETLRSGLWIAYWVVIMVFAGALSMAGNNEGFAVPVLAVFLYRIVRYVRRRA